MNNKTQATVEFHYSGSLTAINLQHTVYFSLLSNKVHLSCGSHVTTPPLTFAKSEKPCRFKILHASLP